MEDINKISFEQTSDMMEYLVYEYGLPSLTEEALITFGQHAARVYGLYNEDTRLTFDLICACIIKFIKTPFGAKLLQELTQCH